MVYSCVKKAGFANLGRSSLQAINICGGAMVDISTHNVNTCTQSLMDGFTISPWNHGALGPLMWPGSGQHIQYSGLDSLRAFSAPYRNRLKNLPKTTEPRNYCLSCIELDSMFCLSLHTVFFRSSLHELFKKAIHVVTICTNITYSISRGFPNRCIFNQGECWYPSSAALYSIHFVSLSWFHLTRFC